MMSNNTDATELLHLAAERLRANPHGFLITVNNATPRARLVQPLRVDDSATISIGTSPRSRKAGDLRRAAEATFVVEDRPHFAYVAVSGTCTIIEDAVPVRVTDDESTAWLRPRVRSAR
jgi:general stress protein 26